MTSVEVVDELLNAKADPSHQAGNHPKLASCQ